MTGKVTNKPAGRGAFKYLSAKVNLLPPSFERPLILSLFPSISWWSSVLHSEGLVTVFTGSTSKKPLPYNRYGILTANGVQQLSVPLKGGGKQKAPLSELRIDYTHDWQRQHWGALYSAYGRAPFYEHYAPALEALIRSNCGRLEELNLAAINWLAREMRIDLAFETSQVIEACSLAKEDSLASYHQVFEDRWGFQPHLSAIDLLMNEGPYAASFLNIL